MKKAAVKKPVFLPIFWGTICVVCIVLCFLAAPISDRYTPVLMTVLFVLPLLFAAVYDALWQISFDDKRIRVRRLWNKREYGYHDIRSVCEYHSSKPASRIIIELSDGRKLRFDDSYSDFSAARNMLLRHMSIRVVE